MNNPLRYQMTEYDCGHTSMLNAVSYLFQREEIPPEIVRSIMLYCLDCFGADGACGKCGTSCTAMMFLSNWINSFGQTGSLPLDACDKLGVPREVSSVLIPVGATCHMDGACIATIYEIALCCSLFGHPLNSIGDFAFALVIAVAGSVTVSSVPSGGAAMETMVISAFVFSLHRPDGTADDDPAV